MVSSIKKKVSTRDVEYIYKKEVRATRIQTRDTTLERGNSKISGHNPRLVNYGWKNVIIDAGVVRHAHSSHKEV